MTTPNHPLTPAATPNRLLLLGALGGAMAILLLVIAILIGYWLGRTSQPNAVQPTQTAHTPSSPATPASLLPAVVTDDPLIATPLPADPALAAEEIDRHSDQQQQLTTQKQTLSQQVTDSNQLIELKAEQIRLLEAELAKQP